MAMCLTGMMTATPTAAAPVRGEAEVTVAGDGAAARRDAMHGARQQALEAAMADLSLTLAVEPARVDALRAQWRQWTGAYRVLEVTRTPTTWLAMLEVDVDLERLRKELARDASTVAPMDAPWRLLSVRLEGCGRGLTAAVVARRLAQRGVQDARGQARPQETPAMVDLRVRCTGTGKVPMTHLRGARVSLEATSPGVPPLRVTGVGLGGATLEAVDSALEEALEGFVISLARRSMRGVDVELRGPWRARDTGGLAQRMTEAVRGVLNVRLSGTAPDGAPRLFVETEMTPEELMAQLESLTFLGKRSAMLEMKSKTALTVTIPARDVEDGR